MSMSTQVLWKQPWSAEAERTLLQALAPCGCSMSELSSQHWDSKTSSIGGVRANHATYLAPASDTWSSAMLHLGSFLGEPLAAELSRLTGGPAIVLLEYDQDAWGYALFDGGALVDRFWSVPAAVDTAPEECMGNAEAVYSVFGVSPESVAPYIRHITEAEHGVKAFDDDEFTLGDHWVRVDFLRRLGLSYPAPGDTAGGRYVAIAEPGL
jgi:hypothetical protein